MVGEGQTNGRVTHHRLGMMWRSSDITPTGYFLISASEKITNIFQRAVEGWRGQKVTVSGCAINTFLGNLECEDGLAETV